MIHCLLAGSALVATALVAGTAFAAERVLVLEVVVNGRATGRVAEFLERDGAVYAKPSDLIELGFMLPEEVATGSELVPLSVIPDFLTQVDEGGQRLLVKASDAALRPTELGARAVSLAALSPVGFGAVLNYDMAATFNDGRATGGALAELTTFSPYGVLASSALVNLTPLAGQRRFVRLETVFTGTDLSRLRRWRVGDVVTAVLPWSRAVRLGGIQIGSDFELRPDLVTYPLPGISASAAVPSTVNVMVNGIQQLSQPVQPGPFAFRSLPVVTGSGEIAVTVSDPLGRQTLITIPFYVSASLLRPGLARYSFEAGTVRENFAQSDDRYVGWAASQSSRFGLTEWLTLDSHAEATGRMGLVGGGATMRVGTFGIVNVAAAGSIGRGKSQGRRNGAMVALGFERTTARLSVGVSGSYSTPGYHDIAAEHGSPVAKASLNANLGYQLGRFGSLGVAYSGRISRPSRGGLSAITPDKLFTTPGVSLITGSYSAPVAGRAAFYATGFKDLRRRGSFGASLGISFAFGRTNASVQASLDGGKSTWSANVSRSAQKQGDFGYRAQLSEGGTSRRSLEGEYLGSWGRVSGGADISWGRIATRAGARGSVVLAGGNLFATDHIHDSFAVVSTGSVAGVSVLYENRPVGVTNAHGKLLIPSMLSYRNNRLAIDTARLPADIEVGQTTMQVRPPDRAGVVVNFDVRRTAAALLTLHEGDGLPIPLGSTVRIEGGDPQAVGYDGEAYVGGLKPSNRAEIVLPSGATCRVSFGYSPVPGEIPLIGPLQCR